MPHYPEFATFSKLASTADYVPVYRRVLSDVLTPVSAFHKIDDGGAACLFESVVGGEKVGRYSFLAGEPFQLIEARGTETTTTNYDAEATSSTTLDSGPGHNPLDELRDLVKEFHVGRKN